MSKKFEIIRAHLSEIKDAMITRYRTVINCRGRIQYRLYIWEDGEIEALEQVQGDHTYLAPLSGETRELYYIFTVAAPGYDPRDQITDPLPDSEEEQEALFEEVDAWMVDEYKDGLDDVLDVILEEAEQEED